MQLWTTTVASPRATARTAREREAAGWDGLLVVDSQNLSGDPYVALAMAATATTAPRSRHRRDQLRDPHRRRHGLRHRQCPRLSGGRAVLGIGRGNSALAHLGRAPARPAPFERYLRQLQTYLRGEAVPSTTLIFRPVSPRRCPIWNLPTPRRPAGSTGSPPARRMSRSRPQPAVKR